MSNKPLDVFDKLVQKAVDDEKRKNTAIEKEKTENVESNDLNSEKGNAVNINNDLEVHRNVVDNEYIADIENDISTNEVPFVEPENRILDDSLKTEEKDEPQEDMFSSLLWESDLDVSRNVSIDDSNIDDEPTEMLFQDVSRRVLVADSEDEEEEDIITGVVHEPLMFSNSKKFTNDHTTVSFNGTKDYDIKLNAQDKFDLSNVDLVSKLKFNSYEYSKMNDLFDSMHADIELAGQFIHNRSLFKSIRGIHPQLDIVIEQVIDLECKGVTYDKLFLILFYFIYPQSKISYSRIKFSGISSIANFILDNNRNIKEIEKLFLSGSLSLIMKIKSMRNRQKEVSLLIEHIQEIEQMAQTDLDRAYKSFAVRFTSYDLSDLLTFPDFEHFNKFTKTKTISSLEEFFKIFSKLNFKKQKAISNDLCNSMYFKLWLEINHYQYKDVF